MADRGNEKNVLVVMNDAHTRMTIRTTLERAGYIVKFIDDGDEALAWCRTSRPDVLLVGSRLTKMDGFVFLYRLTGDGLARIIPTILIAEASEKNRERMAMSRGAKAFLIKPIKVRKLLEHVIKNTKTQTRDLDEQYNKQIAKLTEQDKRESERPPPKVAKPGAPIRVQRKLVTQVRRPRNASRTQQQGPRHDLLQKLRDEVRRLKGIPYHKRLGLEIGPTPDDVDNAFRILAMPYHPDRYRHHGKDARRLAQGVFMLLNDAKRSLRPKVESKPGKREETPKASESWQQLPPKRDEAPTSQANWKPAMIDLTDIDPPSHGDEEEPSRDVSAHSTPGEEDAPTDRESGERATPPSDPEARERASALGALAEGRYRDAKNQIGRLIAELDEDETDTELMLSDKLARGHLRWEENDLDEALELFEDALALDAECPEAISAIADVKEARAKQSRGLLGRFLGK